MFGVESLHFSCHFLRTSSGQTVEGAYMTREILVRIGFGGIGFSFGVSGLTVLEFTSVRQREAKQTGTVCKKS